MILLSTLNLIFITVNSLHILFQALFFNYCCLGQEDTAKFFADNGLHVIASLPCYSAKNVNMQRGKGVFDRSIHALIMLNELGYGHESTGLQLDLVYNPLGLNFTVSESSLN